MGGELKIIVDQRERNADLLDRLEKVGFTVEVETIPVGDYIISDRVCIERKTASDFESSIMSGRLFDQLERMREAYERPIVIIEKGAGGFRLAEKVITGTLSAIYVDYGIPIILSEGPANTAEILASLANREQNGKRRDPSLKGAARAKTVRNYQEFMVGNLPGVGPKLARSLLTHFGSIRKLANADPKEMMDVEKIGKKKAEQIHRTINEVYIPEN